MASISFMASSTIATVLLAKQRKGPLGPYRRIVLSLSVADIIQSMCIIAGPFAVKRGSMNAYWAIGTESSCDVQGFFIHTSTVAMGMYIFALNIYFLLRIKYGMSREKFEKVFEWKCHAFILVWNVATNLYLALTDNFNPSTYGSLCTSEPYPTMCVKYPEIYGECTRGTSGVLLAKIFGFGPLILCVIGTITCLWILNQHVNSKTQSSRSQLHTNSQPEYDDDDTTSSAGKHGSVCKKLKNIWCSPRRNQINSLSLADAYRREMLVQGFLYTFGLMFTYSMLFICLILHSAGIFVQWPDFLNSFAWPIGGVINILIYTRPKITVLRIRQPELSWIRAFYEVIMAGAEVPEAKSCPPPERHSKSFPPPERHLNLHKSNQEVISCEEESKLEEIALDEGNGIAIESYTDRMREVGLCLVAKELTNNCGVSSGPESDQLWSMNGISFDGTESQLRTSHTGQQMPKTSTHETAEQANRIR